MRRAGREEGIDGGRVVRRREDPPESRHDRVGDLLTAEIIEGLGAYPPSLAAGLHDGRCDRVDIYLPLPKLRGTLVHLRQGRKEDSSAHPHRRLQDHVEGFSAMIGEIGVLCQRDCVEMLVEQKLQISHADEFTRHCSLPIDRQRS